MRPQNPAESLIFRAAKDDEKAGSASAAVSSWHVISIVAVFWRFRLTIGGGRFVPCVVCYFVVACVALAIAASGCRMCASPYDYCGPVCDSGCGGRLWTGRGSGNAPYLRRYACERRRSVPAAPSTNYAPQKTPTPATMPPITLPSPSPALGTASSRWAMWHLVLRRRCRR